MKMKKLARVFTSAVLVSAMVATMGGMTAFAEEQTVDITKTVTKEENVYAPKTDFKFKIEAGQPVAGSAGQAEIKAGPMDKISFDDAAKVEEETDENVKVGKISSVPDTERDIGHTSVIVGSAKIKINIDDFGSDKTYDYGIYRYKLTEMEPDEKYEGVYYTKEEKNLDVYVYGPSKNASGEDVPGGVRFVITGPDADASTGKDDGDFVNTYKDNNEDDPTHPVTGPKNLVITKTVTGNQGVVNDEYAFSVKIDGAEGEWYYIVIENTEESDTRPVDVDVNRTALVSGQQYPVKLKGSQKATIYGLTDTDKYTIEETDYSGSGYTTTINGTEGRTVTDVLNKQNEKIVDTTIAFVNDKDVTTPTGIVLSFAPYILLVALAGVFGVLFLRRRKEEF